jgi:hypothetical protein
MENGGKNILFNFLQIKKLEDVDSTSSSHSCAAGFGHRRQEAAAGQDDEDGASVRKLSTSADR